MAWNNNKNSKKSDNNNQKKHSGCKKITSYVDKKTAEVKPAQMIQAWNYSVSRGMMTMIASPRKKGAATKNPNQKMFTCKVFFKRTLETKYYLGFYNETTGKLTIPDLQMVANPKAKNGGYFGTFVNA